MDSKFSDFSGVVWEKNMGGYFIFGRNRKDFGLMIDFYRKRAIVRANTAWIDGISLERIPPSISGFSPGMVLVNRDWKNLYFLMEREGWQDEDYFDFAMKVMKEKGIVKP